MEAPKKLHIQTKLGNYLRLFKNIVGVTWLATSKKTQKTKIKPIKKKPNLSRCLPNLASASLTPFHKLRIRQIIIERWVLCINFFLSGKGNVAILTALTPLRV